MKLFKKNRQLSRLKTTWSISYFIILMIPIVIISIYGIHSISVLKSEYTKKGADTLSHKVQEIDNRFGELIHLSYNLMIDDYLLSLDYAKEDSINGGHHLNKIYLQKELRRSVASNNMLSEIYIYFSNIHTLLSSQTVYTLNLSNNMGAKYLNQNDLDIIQAILEQYSDSVVYYSQRNDSLYFVQKLRQKTNSPSSLILYQIAPNFLSDSIQCDSPELSMYIDVGQEFIISSNDIVPNLDLSISGSITEQASALLNNICYISVIDQPLFERSITTMLLLFVLTVCMAAILGIVFSFYFVRKNYAPIKEILMQIGCPESTILDIGEYRLILNQITTTHSELETQRRLMQNEYLKKLLYAEISYEQFIHQNNFSYGISFHAGYIFTVIIQIAPNAGDNRALIDFIIENVLSELLSDLGLHILYCNTADQLIALCHYDNDIPDQDHIKNSLNYLAQFCEEHFSFKINIGISRLNQQPHLISHAYAQSCKAIEYIRLFETGNIMFFEDIPLVSPDNGLMLKNSDVIMSLCKNSSHKEIDSYFESIQHYISTNALNAQRGNYLMYYLYQILYDLYLFCKRKYVISLADELEKELNHFMRHSLVENIELVKNFYLAAMQFVSLENVSESVKPMEKVKQYIETNYFDMDMNLNTIADYFHITPAYLSKKFKQEEGNSINSYLYQIRLEQATELLHKKELTVAEIATLVGFSNSNAFIRIFKQYKGTSPGKYREKLLTTMK